MEGWFESEARGRASCGKLMTRRQSASSAGHFKPFSSVSITCCASVYNTANVIFPTLLAERAAQGQALLEAKAEVTESTLTSVLRTGGVVLNKMPHQLGASVRVQRRGLGRGPESEAALLDALLRQYTRPLSAAAARG